METIKRIKGTLTNRTPAPHTWFVSPVHTAQISRACFPINISHQTKVAIIASFHNDLSFFIIYRNLEIPRPL